MNPQTKQKITTSYYDEKNGWIDGYIDQWIDDPTKEHISILGEFGMGKTCGSHYITLGYCSNAINKPKSMV